MNLTGASLINFPNNIYISNGGLFNTGLGPVIDWENLFLNDVGNNYSIDWQNRKLGDAGEDTSLSWGQRIMLDVIGNTCLDWNNRYLYNNGDIITLNWQTRILSGAWNSQGLQVSGNNVVTGGPYYSSSNPSGFITGLNTGSFITTGQTGNFASLINLFTTGNTLNLLINSLSGTLTGNYITTGQTGSFGGGSFNTGTLVGTFALSSQTGNFLTSGSVPYNNLTSGTTGYFTINFSGNPNQQINLVNTGTYTVTGSNYPSSGYVSDIIVFLYNTTTGNSIINFPSGWINIGGGWPTGIVSGKSATMWVRAIDNTGMVIGSYNTQL